MSAARKKVFFPVEKFTEVRGKGMVFTASLRKCGQSNDPVKTIVHELEGGWFDYDDPDNGREEWEIVSVELSRELTTQGLLKDDFGLICKPYIKGKGRL